MNHVTNLEFQRLIGRAMVDSAFRAELISDPVAAATKAGLSLTAEQAAELSKIDQFASEQVAKRDGSGSIEAYWG